MKNIVYAVAAIAIGFYLGRYQPTLFGVLKG